MSVHRRPAPDIADVVAGLRARARSLVQELLPNGKPDGDEWCVGSVDGEPGQSCRVHIGRARPGVWSDFSTGEVGDALDLVAAVLFRGDKRKAYRWGVSWLGLDDGDPWRLAKRREAIKQAAAKADADGKEREDRFRRAAQRIFFGAEQRLPGTLAWRYLTETRGIDLASLGKLPRALRFAPDLVFAKGDPRRFPALVAAITGPGGEFLAVHRHFLKEEDGRAIKAVPGREAKKSLGRYKDGGYIRVWRGASGRPWNTPEPGDWVMVTEGLEDALTLAVTMPERRIACAVSASAMPNIRWPEGIAGVYQVRDNDGIDAKTDRAYEAAVRNWQAQGLAVRVVTPPPAFKDFNDMLRGERLA